MRCIASSPRAPGWRRAKPMRARVIALAFAAATAAGAPACTSAWAVVQVMASTADLAALATAIAGEPAEGDLAGVSVDAIVPAGVDAGALEPRPGDIEKLRHADVIVRVGLGYDYWLDRLLVRAGNARLMRGGDGYVDGSAGIPLL